LKYSEKEKIRTYIEVVEWHQPFEYKYGSVNPRCISTKAAFYKMAPRVGNILAISNKIADYYEKNNCHVEVFPVFVDTDSQNLDNQIVDKNYIHLIYPGNPINKDNVATMLKALLSLERCELEKIIFHMTGNTEKQIRNILCKEDFLIDKLGEHIVFHGWMEYEDLIDLYHKMDFLYMSRFDNAVSQANFPSKLPELMGWGIVPVCNKVGDYYHYLTDNENAIIFESDSVEDCANALKRVLLLSPKERQEMRKNARQCAIDKFDYRSWQKKLTDFMGLQ
jgi:glycosyltransferase involved in cell wall biosynthesis